MQDRIEADQHVRYVGVDVPGFWPSERSAGKLLTYHTYDDLSDGDEVRICGGVAEGATGTVVDAPVEPPTLPSGEPIYSYRCERLPDPNPVEVIVRYSDGSVRIIPVDAADRVEPIGGGVTVEVYHD